MKIQAGWKRIVLVFGALTMLLLVNFAWQVKRINKSFREHSLTHSRVLGAVVELNIRNAMMSHRGMESVMAGALENSARFVRYLNQLEPFAPRELEAFAAEAGLAGITIFNNAFPASPTMGPAEWLDRSGADLPRGLTFLPRHHLYVYVLPPMPGEGDAPSHDGVMVGMSALPVEKVQKTLSVERLLSLLNQMQGIEYVRFEASDVQGEGELPLTRLVYAGEKPVSETRVAMDGKILVVGLEANYFSGRMAALKKELMAFISLLVVLALMAARWLYVIQQQRLEQTRVFERKMARQLEQASLGRAAATITHEMRNPLNAISMGLQRLQMEAHTLDQDHCDLVASMRQAVERSNAVISRLQQYVQPFAPGHESVNMDRLLHSLGVLYRSLCNENGISLNLNLTDAAVVTGDAHYLSQAFENLFKNAVEAQPRGGFIEVGLHVQGENCMVHIENSCPPLSVEETQKLLKPYFTTKTHGTGLGLVISKKIVAAHGGALSAVVQEGRFCVTVTLPLSRGTE